MQNDGAAGFKHKLDFTKQGSNYFDFYQNPDLIFK